MCHLSYKYALTSAHLIRLFEVEDTQTGKRMIVFRIFFHCYVTPETENEMHEP